jgi:hypothetical protein
MAVRPSRKKPFKDMTDEDWKLEANTLWRLRILLDALQPGVAMDDVQLAELVAIRTAWEVRR